jgi:hypothetical protein
MVCIALTIVAKILPEQAAKAKQTKVVLRLAAANIEFELSSLFTGVIFQQ